KSFPLLGTNGARTGLDIARFLLSGASAVQVTSAVFTGGFGAGTSIRDDFASYLERQQVTARELIGSAADQFGTYAEQQSRPGYWEQFVVPEART
ncbi:MAG: hypothetical protein ACTHLY_04510, partial [Pseudolabrys sp.]